PAIGVLQLPTGKRIVACWVDFFTPSGNNYLYTAYSPDGIIWYQPQVLGGPNAGLCTLGGSSSELAITWRESSDDPSKDVLRIRTSKDGLNWTDAHTLGTVGSLV